MKKKKISQEKAISVVADGHTFWKVSYAKRVCKVFDLELPDLIISTYNSQKEANPTNHYKGLFLNKDTKFPVSGVEAADLSDYIAGKVLGHAPPSGGFIGRGFGAQANAEAVEKKLNGLKENEAVVGG